MPGIQSRSSLVGKVAVITGGAKGVGAATAQRLIDKGAAVAIVDLTETRAAQSAGPPMITLSGDVTRLSDMTEAVDKVLDHFGRIDIVIANAGVAARGATLRASSPEVVSVSAARSIPFMPVCPASSTTADTLCCCRPSSPISMASERFPTP